MALWFALVLGVVQGLTEFLPISSTAHLRIVPALLGQPDPGASYTAVIQLGTLLAVVVYFARDLLAMPRALVRAPGTPAGRLPLYIVLGTVPIVVLGVALKRHIVGDLRSLYVVAGALAVVGVAMAWVDRAVAGGRRAIIEVGAWDALLIGFAQAAALVPGVSRSGATITMALVLGFRRADAARYSFLLGIPAIAGAGIFELRDAAAVLGADAVPALAVGTVAAALSGYASIAWLLRFLATHRLTPFAIYRVALAALLVALCAAGVVSAVG